MKGRGVSKDKVFKRKCEAKQEYFQWGRGGGGEFKLKKKFQGRGMDIIRNNTIEKHIK